MTEASAQLQVVLDFVSGVMKPEAFAEALSTDPAFERLLDDGAERPRPDYQIQVGCPTTYHYLLTLDLSRVSEVVSAQGALAEFLDRRGIAHDLTHEHDSSHQLLLDAQPSWLDVDSQFLQNHILAQAPIGMKKAALVKWIKARLSELFRFAAKPPHWLQSPQWPIRDAKPLVFLGQIAVKDYFHDAAAVFVFHDPVAGECVTVLQVL